MDDIAMGMVKEGSIKAKYVGNYELIKTIGEGSFAKVKIATHRFNGQQVAIKIIDKTKLPEASKGIDIHRESMIMKKMDHPNIVQLFEVMETTKNLYFVLEYACGGEVLDEIMETTRFSDDEARRISRQIVSALVISLTLIFRSICILTILFIGILRQRICSMMIRKISKFPILDYQTFLIQMTNYLLLAARQFTLPQN
jgi:serine/threonine protein kinase